MSTGQEKSKAPLLRGPREKEEKGGTYREMCMHERWLQFLQIKLNELVKTGGNILNIIMTPFIAK